MLNLWNTSLPKVFVGLPSTQTGSRQRSLRNPRLGATQTVVGSQTPLVPVTGQPSMKLLERITGGVQTVVRRNSRYTDFISEVELNVIRRELRKAQREAELLSLGTLTPGDLNGRGHPYGRGTVNPQGARRAGLGRLQKSRRGVSNKSVLNRRTGEAAGSWGSSVERDKSGITLSLYNTAPHSRYTAFGTRKMQAHGPYTAAMIRILPTVNREFLRLTKQAYLRDLALQQLGN